VFKFLEKSVKNVLEVAEPLVNPDADLPSKDQVAKLIADGLTVYAAAELLGVGVEVVESLMEDE